MNGSALHPTPGLVAAAREQLRAVGLAVRREAAGACVLMMALTLLGLFYAVRAGESLPFGSPSDLFNLAALAGGVALLAPFAAWKGEERFGSSTLWFLPVDARRHALVKTMAGWAWLMTVLAGLLAWLLLLSVVSGGAIGPDETVRLLDPSRGTGVRVVGWSASWWQWTAPFTAATALYLMASAVLLASRHPVRWVGGVLLALFLAGWIGEQGDISWLVDASYRALYEFIVGPFGLDALLSGGFESFDATRDLPSGETVKVWQDLPTVGRWGQATLVWLGLGLAAVFGAASRHREG